MWRKSLFFFFWLLAFGFWLLASGFWLLIVCQCQLEVFVKVLFHQHSASRLKFNELQAPSQNKVVFCWYGKIYRKKEIIFGKRQKTSDANHDSKDLEKNNKTQTSLTSFQTSNKAMICLKKIPIKLFGECAECPSTQNKKKSTPLNQTILQENSNEQAEYQQGRNAWRCS